MAAAAARDAAAGRDVTVTSESPWAVSWSRASRADEAGGLKVVPARHARTPPAAGGDWDPASADGCPRCCCATLLLANQHQFFSGKLYVLLQ
ncbi:hypothetical protein WISP_71078 [Willisornis vidua]|uniref:Uncharacterized protein n=1 Tax=Willisornis vidua TaxID=1566151 RepID=A0ABQ9DDB5_9PASS|nr:hypothetical protein WISP_71078 [Willisornis vidua]